MENRLTWIRYLLISTLLLSVGAITSIVLFSGVEAGDFRAYYHAAELALRGEPFVGVAPPGVTSYASWVYPPITVLLFIPFTLLGSWLPALVVWNVLNIGVAVAIGYSIFDILREKNSFVDNRDQALIISLLAVGPPAIFNLVQGQSNFIVLGCIFYGFLAIERGYPERAGAIYAIAATIKLWPALLGVWLLYKRSYRAVFAAIVVGVGLQFAGILLFGVESYITLIDVIINDRSSTGTTSLVYMLDNVVGWSSAIATLVSFISVGGVLYLIFRSSTDSPIFKYTATLVATLLVVPSIFQYMIFPYIGLLPAIYLAEEGAHRVRLGLGLILISIPITRYKINNLIEILAGPSLSVPEWVLSLMNVPFWGMILLLAALYLLSREEEGHTSLSPENP